MNILCDPPEGWMHGFPKPFSFSPSSPDLPAGEYEAEFIQWFIDNGYPEEKARDGVRLKHVRFFGSYEALVKSRHI